jgi:hypothetical protein
MYKNIMYTVRHRRFIKNLTYMRKFIYRGEEGTQRVNERYKGEKNFIMRPVFIDWRPASCEMMKKRILHRMRDFYVRTSRNDSESYRCRFYVIQSL